MKQATEFVIRNCDYFPTHKKFGEVLLRFKLLNSIPKAIQNKSIPARTENTVEDILDQMAEDD